MRPMNISSKPASADGKDSASLTLPLPAPRVGVIVPPSAVRHLADGYPFDGGVDGAQWHGPLQLEERVVGSEGILRREARGRRQRSYLAAEAGPATSGGGPAARGE